MKILLIQALLVSSLQGGIRWTTATGAPFHRTDATNIQFKFNSSTAQTLGGDAAVAAVQAAMNSWNAIPSTAIHFAAVGTTSAGIANDSQNIISFADTPDAINLIGSAIAVTVPYGFADGRITETDIILNPKVKYSTTFETGSYDLQSVITHELGHALGANHTTSLSSTMFWLSDQRDPIWSQLKPDDAAFAVEAYPGTDAGSYGKITGKATKNGAPLLGAAILATDASTGICIGGLSSLSDGTYSLTVPPGNYRLYVSPVTPYTPAVYLYGLPAAQIDTAFKAAAGPAGIQVSGGGTGNGDLSAPSGASAISIVEIGKVVNGTSTWRPTALEALSGQATEVILFGPGLDGSITEQNLTLIGPGVTLRSGSVRSDSALKDSNGYPALHFTIDVAARGGQASASLLITKGSDTALLPGGIDILPAKPSFTAASLVDAASSTGAGVAPGELVSLYGVAVGPNPAVNNNGYDAATGLVAGTLGGTTVTFDGIAAPLLYTSSGQVNLQVPYEVAGKSNTTVVVTNQGSASDPVTVPVLAAQPGLFAVGVNQDGSVNGPGKPAPKGTYVIFYATGAGIVDPPVATGKPAPSSPLSFAQTVSVKIGGTDATVYQGGVLAPGFVGLLQVAAQVPANAASGSVPVTLSVAGKTSPAISIVIQ